ncbi:MAG: hypothetical protein KC931_04935 [Candidatus Omnitrophica bacterium]|nr:hypothetical protein [Candidatus Omnitrophota bacterium]
MVKRLFQFMSIGILLSLGGCFSARLLDTPYQEPIASQRDFVDEFDDASTLGNRWRRVSGWWGMTDSQLIQKLAWKSHLPGDFQMAYVNGLASGAYEAETRLNFLHPGEQAAGILLRFQDQNNFYMLRIRHYPRWQDNIDLVQYISGERREDLRRMDISIHTGQWYTLRAEDRGNEIVAFLDGNELFRYPTRDRAVGTVGLATKTGKVAFEHFAATLYEPDPEAPEVPTLRRKGEDEPPLSPHNARGITSLVPNPDDFRFDPDISEE